MGCGCRNAQTTEVSTVKSKPQSAKENKKVVVLSENRPTEKVVKKGVCDQLYSELSVLDAKTYDLFKRTRLDGSGDDYEWLQTQRQIREWKKELNERCPDETLLAVARMTINSEYEKLFG